MSYKVKHLDFIQNTISRLAQNSFLIKGWSIFSVSTVLAIVFREGRPQLALISALPLSIFWYLDGYFVSLERQFRELYDEVRSKDEADIDFSMRSIKGAPGMGAQLKAVFSKSLLPFYGTLLAVLLLLPVFFS